MAKKTLTKKEREIKERKKFVREAEKVLFKEKKKPLPFKLKQEGKSKRWVARSKGRILSAGDTKKEASTKAVKFLRTGKPVTDRLVNVVEIQYSKKPSNIERFGTWRINARFKINRKRKFVGNFWASSNVTKKQMNLNTLLNQAQTRALLRAVKKEGLIPEYESEIIPPDFRAELLRFKWVVYRPISEAERFEFPRA